MSALFKADRGVKNPALLGEAMRLMKAGTLKIACIGDSMTYGHDTVSAGTVAPVAPHVVTRVPTPYPETMIARLNEAYAGATMTVENMGFSGDNVKQGFSRWKTANGAALAFIMYGINDAIPSITLDEYASVLRKFIRRLNSQGCAVVVVTSTMMTQGREIREVNNYRAAAVKVAEQMGCPVMHGDGVGIQNQYSQIFSDSVHFNQQGYTLFGNSVAAFLLGGGLGREPNRVNEERTFLVGDTACMVSNGAYSHGAGAYAVQDLVLTITKGTNQRVTFAFFLDADAADIYPIGVLSLGQTVRFDANSPRPAATEKRHAAGQTENYTVQKNDVRSQNHIPLKLGRVVGRGWHMIDISAPDVESTQQCYLSGFRVRPVTAQLQSTNATVGEKRVVSVFDPAINYKVLPPASNATTLTIEAEHLHNLVMPNADIGFYQSMFATVEIMSFSGVSGARYWRGMLRVSSAAALQVLEVESIGANPTKVTAVAGPTVQNSGTSAFTLTLSRPEADYIEVRISSVESFANQALWLL